MSDDKHFARVGKIRWRPVGGGAYKPVVEVLPNQIDLCKIEAGGFHLRAETVSRLIAAGFVKGEGRKVDVLSLQRHIEACKDRWFWTPERRAHYWPAGREGRCNSRTRVGEASAKSPN